MKSAYSIRKKSEVGGRASPPFLFKNNDKISFIFTLFMPRKLGPLELAKSLAKFKKRYPNPTSVVNDYEQLRQHISILIKTTTKSRAQVAKSLGITENAMYNKMAFPKRWKEKEIKKLIKLLY
jgi:DNA polymerase III delta subunit